MIYESSILVFVAFCGNLEFVGDDAKNNRPIFSSAIIDRIDDCRNVADYDNSWCTGRYSVFYTRTFADDKGHFLIFFLQFLLCIRFTLIVFIFI